MADQLKQLYDADEIAARVSALAAEIGQSYDGREFTVLGVLDDSFVFLADLLRGFETTVRTAFVRFDHRHFGGMQDLSFTTQTDLRGRDVLLVEGVIGTGVTQEYLMKQLAERGAATVRLCVLLNKPDRRRVSVEPDFYAFETHEDFVVGYGLGMQERYRQLPFLAATPSTA